MIDNVQQVLVAPASEPGWRDQLADRLGILRQTFADHVLVTEGHDGLYAELLEHAPRLVSGVRLLEREHEGLTHGIEIVHHRVVSAARDDLRCWSIDLLTALLRHRQRGADLVYEAYGTDLGGET